MTAITFPNSPSSGDTHTAGNGIVYTYDGEKWTSIGTNSAGTWTRSGTTVSLTNAGDDLNVDSGTFFVDASANKVGIGTTTPSEPLHVGGNVISDGSIKIGSYDGGNGTLINNTATTDVVKATGDVYTVRNTSGGTPKITLNASGSITAGSIISGANPNLGGNSGVQIVSDGILRVSKASGNVFEAWTTGSSTHKVAINSDGTVNAAAINATGQIIGESEIKTSRFGTSVALGAASDAAFRVGTAADTKAKIGYDGTALFGTTYKVKIRPFNGANADQLQILDTSNAVKASITGNGSAVFEGGIDVRTQDSKRGLTINSSSSSQNEALKINANGGAQKILLKHDGSAYFAENLGIGTTSPDGYAGKFLQIHDTGVRSALRLTNSNSGATKDDGFEIENRDGYVQINYRENGYMSFLTNNSERVRITNSGTAMIPNTGGFPSVPGHTFYASGQAMHATNSDTLCLLLNRQHSDGTLVDFRHASASEGSISVNGSTVSYNGGHLSRWSQLAGGAKRIEILRGSVLSNLDEMCEWAYEAQDAVLWTEEDKPPEGINVGDIRIPARAAGIEENEQLNRMKVSDTEGDKNVAGVFQCWDDDDDVYTDDFYCAVTGDFIIRIAQGTTVARGDLLMSAGDGTAKPQEDDIIRSKTIAKVTSTHVSETYNDGSYCVPCVLMAC